MLLIFMVTVYSIGVEIKDRTAREDVYKRQAYG